MALTYNRDVRDLSIRGQITFNTGDVLNITVDDILSYSFSSSIGADGLPLGGTEAASFTLELDNVGRRFTPAQFDNAQVHMYIGIVDNGEYTWSDFGVWYVDGTSAPEQSVSVQLSGCDALASRFEINYTDTASAYPTTIGSLASTVCTAAGVSLKSANFPNAAVTIPQMPAWPEDVTLRDILSWCAVCAGGYTRIERDGRLAIVSFADGETYALGSGLYHKFTPTGGTAFSFNAIEAMINEDDEDYTRFAIDESIEDNPTNTIQLDHNPLLTAAIVNSVVSELQGITMQAGTVEWGGDPSVNLGDYYSVTTLNGTVYKIMVTSQSFSFDGGLSATEDCTLPALNSTHSASYSTTASAFNADGKLRATRIDGLDRSVISATVAHFNNLTAETAEFDTLLSAYISALNLVADKINAGVIKTNQLYAEVIEAVAAHINDISAQTISTDTIAAAFAHLMNIVAGDIRAQQIETDQLAAVMADIVTITAGTAQFDFATIQNLLSNALILQQGYAESVMITNLTVTSANMLDATIGHLVLRGNDNAYYEINIGSDGTVSTKVVEISPEEIDAGVTTDGRQIVQETVNAQSLNGQTVKASEAILNTILTSALTAGQITANEALIASASIPTLYTTSLKALGDSLDLSANESINFYVGQQIEGIRIGTRNYLRQSRSLVFSDTYYLTEEGASSSSATLNEDQELVLTVQALEISLPGHDTTVTVEAAIEDGCVVLKADGVTAEELAEIADIYGLSFEIDSNLNLVATVPTPVTPGTASYTTPEVTVYDGTEDTVLALTDAAGAAWHMDALPYNEAQPAFFSVWAKASAAMNVQITAAGQSALATVGTDWTRICMQIPEPDGTAIEIAPLGSGTLYLYKAMFEADATRVSDWTCAPEDTEAEEAAIRGVADSAAFAAGSAQDTANEAMAVAQEAGETSANVRRWMSFTANGLYQGKAGSTYSTLIDDEGFHILQLNEKIGSFAKRRLAAEEVRVGKVSTTQTRCVMREAGDGGMIITVEGLT